jgi:hypothetical protein
MQIDPSQHSVADNYKLLTNLVVPRPIAWVTSVNVGGEFVEDLEAALEQFCEIASDLGSNEGQAPSGAI